ncbi:MAG TPA: chalcone isomerase family protein [Bacteroidia bacterium]|nr:chalcone isomerase family protein [Bacteroidia bacterium]
MKDICYTTAFFILFLSVTVSAQTLINNITFPNTYKAGTEQLVLNGGGTRQKYWMDMYVGALYLPAKSKDASSIISANNPMVIRMCIVSGLISSAKMIKAVDEGFEKSVGNDQSKFKWEIDQFKKAFSDPIKVGDVFDAVYEKDKLSIYKNNVLKAEIPGFSFKKAVFGIWLGANPADENLKKGMLGN